MLSTLLISLVFQFVYFRLTEAWFYVDSVDALSLLMSLFNVSSGWFVTDNNLNMPIWYYSTLMLQWAIFYMLRKEDKGKDGRFRVGALLMVVLGLSILLGGTLSGPFLYENSARGYYCFFLGCLLCDYYNIKKSDKRFCQRVSWIAMSSMIIFLLASFHYGRIAALGNSQIIWGAFFCPSLIWCALNLEFVKKLLLLRPLQFLGKLSLHIYFWHFNCYFFLRIISEIVQIRQYYSQPLFWGIAILFIIVISYFSLCFFNRKGSLKKLDFPYNSKNIKQINRWGLLQNRNKLQQESSRNLWDIINIIFDCIDFCHFYYIQEFWLTIQCRDENLRKISCMRFSRMNFSK